MSKLTTLIEEIRELGPIPFEDEENGLTILPPAKESDVAAIRESCGGELPAELEEMLRLTAGFLYPALDFQPEPERSGPDGFESLLRASHYGNGDGFALEPCGEMCRVWWAGHDPWFLIYWAPSIAAFLELWLERARALQAEPEPSGELWEPAHLSRPAGAGGDAELEKFRAAFPRGTVVHDLRQARPGTEIPLARLQSLTPNSLRRHDLIFAFLPPPAPVAVEPMPINVYQGTLDEADAAILRALPKGSLVVHERDLPQGGYLDASAHPNQDVAWRPPFHVVYPKKPWWHFW